MQVWTSDRQGVEVVLQHQHPVVSMEHATEHALHGAGERPQQEHCGTPVRSAKDLPLGGGVARRRPLLVASCSQYIVRPRVTSSVLATNSDARSP